MPEGGSAGWWSGVEWGSPGPLIIFTGGAGLVTPKHESVTTQTWASSHWLAVRGASQQHMAVLLLCALSDNILMFPWIVNGNLVILDLDFEFQLATSVFYRAYLTTVLRGKDVANGILWEKKNLIDKILVVGLENRLDLKVQRWTEAHWLKCPHGYNLIPMHRILVASQQLEPLQIVEFCQ